MRKIKEMIKVMGTLLAVCMALFYVHITVFAASTDHQSEHYDVHTEDSADTGVVGDGASWTLTVVVNPNREYTCSVPAGQDVTVNELYVLEGYILEGVEVYYSSTYAPVTGFRCGYETVTIPGEYVTADLTIYISVRTLEIDAHRDHVYAGAPTFTWKEDYSAAKATWVCLGDGNTNTVDCTVTSQTQNATCKEDGKTTYTATATLGDTDYTDTKTVSISKDTDNHTPGGNGKCTVCGYQYAASVTYESNDSTTQESVKVTDYYATFAEAMAKLNEATVVKPTLTVLDHSVIEDCSIDSDETIVINKDVTLTISGTLTNNGIIVNNGTLSLPEGFELSALTTGNYSGSGTVTVGTVDYVLYNGTWIQKTDGSTGIYIYDNTPATYYTCGEGYAIFTPTSGDTAAILELNNATITGANYELDGSANSSYAIRYTSGNLTINFSGTNTIIGGSAPDGSEGIYVSDDLTLTGTEADCILNAVGGTVGSADSSGISCKNLMITSGTVNATGGTGKYASSYGVLVFGSSDSEGNIIYGTVTVAEGAVLNAIGGNAEGMSVGLFATATVTSHGTLTASGGASGTGLSLGIFGLPGSVVEGNVTATVCNLTVDLAAQTGNFSYTVLGNAALSGDLNAGIYVQEGLTATFTVPDGTSLTISADTTLDLSKVAPESIDIQGNLIVNGTLILPSEEVLSGLTMDNYTGTVKVGNIEYILQEGSWYPKNGGSGGTTQLPEAVKPDVEQDVEPDDEESADNILDTKTVYDIIKGDGGKWTKGSSYDLSFTANGPFDKFVGIEVDGKEVASTYYTAESGSTIIALKQSFLKSLSTGEHTITVLYADGETSGTFKILAEATSPATGDDSNIMLWSVMLYVSTLGRVIYMADRKRRRAAK